jgi:hypothetical protein
MPGLHYLAIFPKSERILERSLSMATADSTPSFARDIQPLFREDDRNAMDYVFDLWDYDDVRTYAQDILERLADGTMPCDEEWPDEQIAQFRRWVEGGMLP